MKNFGSRDKNLLIDGSQHSWANMQTLRGFSSGRVARARRLRVLELAEILIISICSKYRQLQKTEVKLGIFMKSSSVYVDLNQPT